MIDKIKEYFRDRGIRERAKYVAETLGKPIAHGMVYDDNIIRIMVVVENVSIYVIGENDRTEQVFSYQKNARWQHFTEGSWQDHLETCYMEAKEKTRS